MTVARARVRIEIDIAIKRNGWGPRQAFEWLGGRVGLSWRAVEKIADGESVNPNASTLLAFFDTLGIALTDWREAASTEDTKRAHALKHRDSRRDTSYAAACEKES